MTLRRNLFWFALLLICGLAALSSSAFIVFQSISSDGDSTADSTIINSKTKTPNNQSSTNPYEFNEISRQNRQNTHHVNKNINTDDTGNDADESKGDNNAKNADEKESKENTKESPYPEKGYSSSLGLGMSLGLSSPTPYYPERGLNTETRETDNNILNALYWLRDHQNPKNGSWSADNFREQCKTNSPSPYGNLKFNRHGLCGNLNGKNDAGLETYSKVVTGLATLAFLGAGCTHEIGEFKLTVKKALRYIQSIQHDTGCFGPKDEENIMYAHIVCAKAMIDGYIMTNVTKLKAPAQMAVDFIAYAQNEDPDLGWLGWGFNWRDGKSNSFITSWAVMTLYAAKEGGLKVSDRCFEGAQSFLKSVTSYPNVDNTEDKYPRTGLESKLGETTKYSKTPLLDAINIFSSRLMGTDTSDLFLQWQTELIAYAENGNMPSTEEPEKIDFLYWNFASLAMFQMGDTYWYQWKKPAYDSIIRLQRLENEHACAYGSWDPIDAWGSTGGRVYATAINALTLETEYRFCFIK